MKFSKILQLCLLVLLLLCVNFSAQTNRAWKTDVRFYISNLGIEGHQEDKITSRGPAVELAVCTLTLLADESHISRLWGYITEITMYHGETNSEVTRTAVFFQSGKCHIYIMRFHVELEVVTL